MANAVAATTTAREDALVACLVGRAAVYLHKAADREMDLDQAAEAAQRHAGKLCKGTLPSESAGDYVYWMIRAMARTIYSEEDTKQQRR